MCAGAITDTFRYKAFISYSWADRAWGEWLHRALETYRPPASAGAAAPLKPIFKDREEEAAGHSIGAAIEAAMAASEFLIVLCSPNAAQSTWVNREVAWFKTHRDPLKILTVIVGGEPMASLNPGREAEECFPKTLLYKVGADLQPTEEIGEAPLAADARDAGDGKRGAKLKLAAAMLGLGLDHLVRRDDRRRAARRRLVMGAMAASIAVLGGLTVFAFNQRNAAIVARQDAVFQRDEAQSLVEFMLTDLRQRLDAVGRLDILDAVAGRLLESYDKQDLSKLDADSLGRRARVLLLLGEVEGTRGNLDAALARYKEAAAATEELLRRDPDNQKRIFDHAQSVYWVGDIALKRGDMQTVTDYWTQYRDFGARLVELDPDRDEWQTELAYGYRNLAVLAFGEGAAAKAIDGFRRAAAISGRLAARRPDDQALKIVYGDDLSWLATALVRNGGFGEARETLSTEAKIIHALLAIDKTNDEALQRSVVNSRVAAGIDIDTGDVRAGLAALKAQTAIYQSRLLNDSGNTYWRQLYLTQQSEIAEAELALGDVETARNSADAAIEQARQLIQLDETVVDWRIKSLGRCLLIAARAAIAARDFQSAHSHLREIETIVGAIGPGASQEREARKLAVIAAGAEAHLLALTGNAVRARELAEKAAAEIAPLASSSFQGNRTRYAEIALLAGDIESARRIANRLHDEGYRHPDFIRVWNDVKRLSTGLTTPSETGAR